MWLTSFLLLMALASAADDSIPETRREAATTDRMRVHVIRLRPNEDLLNSIASYTKRKKIQSAIVLTAVGSLQDTKLRLANRSNHTAFTGKQEIVSMVGTIDTNGAHLHLSISDGNGKTTGGHLVEGCKIYTTAEIAIGELPDLRFSREKDSASLYEELKIDPVSEK